MACKNIINSDTVNADQLPATASSVFFNKSNQSLCSLSILPNFPWNLMKEMLHFKASGSQNLVIKSDPQGSQHKHTARDAQCPTGAGGWVCRQFQKQGVTADSGDSEYLHEAETDILKAVSCFSGHTEGKG